MMRRLVLVMSCVAAAFSCYTTGQSVKKSDTVDIIREITVPATASGAVYRAYWPDKSLKAEGTVAGTKKNGLWKIYFKGTGGSSVMAEANFKDDLLDGKFKEYYLSGRVKADMTFRAGLLNGGYMTYHESGTGQIERNYRDGLISGKAMEYYDNGNTRENSFYRNGLRDGASTFFYYNGKREAVGRYVAGKKNGLWEHFNEEGFLKERGNYRDDVRTGVWTLYDGVGRPIGEKTY